MLARLRRYRLPADR